MDISPQLEALFGYLYDHIKGKAEREINRICGSERYTSLIIGHSRSSAVLAKYLNSDEAIDAFKRMLEIFGHSVIYDLMSLLAGEDIDGYTYALTDGKSGVDLYPDCGYVDGWTYFVGERDASLEEEEQ